MATNRELRTEATALSTELGVAIGDVERMNNAQLVELVTHLRARAQREQVGAEPEAAAPADTTPEPPAAEPTPAPATTPDVPVPAVDTAGTRRAVPSASTAPAVSERYRMCRGRSVTGPHGMLRGGDVFKPADFPGFNAARLIKLGVIERY